MKRLFITCIVFLSATCVFSAEKKPIKYVETNELNRDTQVLAKGTGDNHVAVAWWIPKEFWLAILSRDTTSSKADKKTMLNTVSNRSLLAVVQADISPLGEFDFYTKAEIDKTMFISYTDASSKSQRLLPIKGIDPAYQAVLSVFKPILGAEMGNLGNNMHFYILNDKTKSSLRLIDPYRKGIINIKLAKRNNELMTANIETPINSLFVPRKCPNGKEAHISWKYCPWSGKKLKE